MKFIKTILFPAVIFCFMLSCKEKKDQSASAMISKDKMIAVLIDVHIAESSLDLNGLNQEQINKAIAPKYVEIMQHNGVTYQQFTSTYQYYMHHPQEMDAIYEEVVNKLTALESQAKAARKPNNPK